MTVEEKVKIIKDRIESLEIHVIALEESIFNYPEADHPDKPPRSLVLQDIKQKIQALKGLEATLD